MQIKPEQIEDAAIPRAHTTRIAKREGVSARTIRRYRSPETSDEQPFACGEAGPIKRVNQHLDAICAEHPAGEEIAFAYLAEKHEQRQMHRLNIPAGQTDDAIAACARKFGACVDAFLSNMKPDQIELKLLEAQAAISRALYAIGFKKEPLPLSRRIGS